ncbi:hypothetical protein CPC08DRAFT_651195 [Agrocybe pediades]|nr:hypothetical protein CPC08DRAFT_651195 [Agrocybe pediades]
MVNPGAFQGARKEFLLGEKAAYVAGVQGGYSKDALAFIQRRYFKRFPIEMPQDQEPSQAELAAVDDEKPDPEIGPLDEDSMTPEDYREAQARREERRKLIEFRKAQIKRWLSYQYMKDHDLDPKDSGAHNPYHALLFQLTGKALHRPRRKPAINVWLGATKGQVASLRERTARKLFDKLSTEEQMTFEQEARDEYDAELAQWKEDMSGPMSQAPESRQRCIQGLVHFIQPVLDMVADATGWKCTFIAGGPEPAHGGRLNVISVHAGTTTGDIKMNFGRSERVRYKEDILPIFGNFLKKCYSTEECRARALKAEDGYEPVDAEELRGIGAALYTIDDAFGKSRDLSVEGASVLHPTSLPNSLPNATAAAHRTARKAVTIITPHTPFPSAASACQDARNVTGRSSSKRKQDTALGTVHPPSKRKKGSSSKEAAVEGASLAVDAVPARRTTRQGRTTTEVSAAQSSAIPPTASTTVVPLDAPDWLKKSAGMFAQGDLGRRWLQLLDAWIVFEAKESYAGHGTLKSEHRPACVGDWIGRRRSPVWRPRTLGPLSQFQVTYMKWPGVNGLQSVIVSLFFWGLEAKKCPGHSEDWAEAVEDLIIVFSGLAM